IDTERAAKVSGSRFGYVRRELALLEFALVQFAIEKLVKNGFVPVVPPVMIREEMMHGMGYIDSEKDREERYFLEKDGLYLIGTAEQSLVPMHADEIISEKHLPLRYAGFSTCFRREAGSYGKDTQGILRVHQFDKVEMVIFSKPEDSCAEHELMIRLEEELMQELQIPYRIVALCTGDISQPSARTIDIESWFPGQNEGRGQYRETHSSSHTTDFQARRLKIRIRKTDDTIEFVHILNGTACAIGRTLIAILENYQQEDGAVKIPRVLQKYMGEREVITEARTS
ncbi:MAG: seryl-tRNA synthetase, partial [Parcubacteria group bacterium Gr01-1014_66]